MKHGEATMKVDSVPPGSQVCILDGTSTEIVGAFKHLLCVTTHPQFLVLELRVPMGTCLGQYGMNTKQRTNMGQACERVLYVYL